MCQCDENDGFRGCGQCGKNDGFSGCGQNDGFCGISPCGEMTSLAVWSMWLIDGLSGRKGKRRERRERRKREGKSKGNVIVTSSFIAHNELSLMRLAWLYGSCIDNYTISDFRPFTIYKTKIVYKKI